MRWLSRTGARCQPFVLVRFPGPLAEPDVQLPPHPALHEAVGLCGRDRVPSIPWRRDLRSPVAVTGDRDRSGVEEVDAVLAELPSVMEVAPAQGVPTGSSVLSADPSNDPAPRVVVEVVEGRLGHAVPEVGGPTSKRQVELAEEIGKWPVCALFRDRLHFGHDRGQRLLRWPRVDDLLFDPGLVLRWTRKPRKSNPSSMWTTAVFLPTGANPSEQECLPRPPGAVRRAGGCRTP